MNSATDTSVHNIGQVKRNVSILAVCQALAMSGTSLVMTVTALAGLMLADDKSLATLPLAVQFLGTMAMTFPASMFMGRVGRRLGFSLGQVIGICGAGLSSYAIFEQSFWIFVVGSFLLGSHNAFWQYFRFAAADHAPVDLRSRAISYVLAGGVVAAFAGPQLSKISVDLFEPVLFAGGYVAIIGLNIASIVLLQFIDMPKPVVAKIEIKGRPLKEIARQPLFQIAVLSALIGYSLMNLVMSATPLAMQVCGFGFNDSTTVIQWHVLAMFAPSFFTGDIIRHFGALKVIMAGIVLFMISMVINISGIEFYHFLSGLVLLGLGWNFMFIGGTSLLTECYNPEERSKVQALNDFMVFAAVAFSSFSSGLLHNAFGWTIVNLWMILPLSIVILFIIRYKWIQRRGSAVVVGSE